jgi:hypothetical protein
MLEALEAALRRGGEARLVKFGPKTANAGLFSDEKGTRKEAIERCLQGASPLLRVVRTETVKNKEHRFVTITLEGIDFLKSQLPAEQVSVLLDVSIQQATQQEKQFEEQLVASVKDLRGILDQTMRLAADVAGRMESAAARLGGEVQAAREWRSQLEKRLPKGPSPPGAPPTDEDYAFVRRVTGDLVFSWEEEQDPNAREALERVLENSGAKRIGSVGERTTFGQHHESSEPVREGDTVEIVQPGWIWEDEQRAFLLAPAKVKVSST